MSVSSALRQLRIQRATIGFQGMTRLAWSNRVGSKLEALEVCRPLVTGRCGLEIGGPSAVFGRTGPLPLYPLLARLDNCDFSGETIWHGVAAEGSAFVYDVDRAPGRRFIRAATELGDLDGAPFDVVLSSHTLEHVANPLLALSEWRRVLASPGHLVVVVPHLENTFDHRRPVTTLEHIEHDSELGIDENDPTHLEEFVELCDLARVPEQLTRDELRARARDQATFRTVHHHVFDTELVVRLLDRAGFQLLWVETALPFHIVAVARPGETGEDNGAFLAPTAAWRRESVFRRDAP